MAAAPSYRASGGHPLLSGREGGAIPPCLFSHGLTPTEGTFSLCPGCPPDGPVATIPGRGWVCVVLGGGLGHTLSPTLPPLRLVW